MEYGLFEYSLYMIPEDTEGSLVPRQLERISAGDRGSGAFTFAVFADPHLQYDELRGAVQRANKDSSLRFVIVAGDATQYGLEREYAWFLKIMSRLSVPYVTVIGNHDALANGARIYRDLLGPLNYSFRYDDVKFVLFNDIVWQFPPPVPDTAWLDSQLAPFPGVSRVIAVSHIPPFGEQFDSAGEKALASLLARRHVSLSIYGHTHHYTYRQYYGDGVPYLVADDIGKRNYLRITVADTGFVVERIFY
jgi:Icc protein